MCDIRFDQAFFVFEVVIVPVVLLSFLVEEFECACFVLLLMALSPVFDDGNDPIWHGEGGNGVGFLDYACINIEYLVCALVVSGRAEEYSWECSGAHCIHDGRVVLGFDIGAKGGFAVFLEVEFAAEDDLPRDFLSNTLAAAGRLLSHSMAK
jgi:hypothetical protein